MIDSAWPPCSISVARFFESRAKSIFWASAASDSICGRIFGSGAATGLVGSGGDTASFTDAFLPAADRTRPVAGARFWLGLPALRRLAAAVSLTTHPPRHDRALFPH